MADLAPEQVAEEAEITLGRLSFTVAGDPRKVPELKWQANREWKILLQTTFARLISVPSDTPDGMNAMLDAERELVIAYDVTHALGDLEDATETEIDAIYNGLVKVAFPLAKSPTAVGMMLIRAAVASAQANSTNGPSPTGTTADLTILKGHLPSAKSSSSTRKRKSA